MKLWFPQLATGAMAQFPLKKTLVRRTVINRLADGREIRLADPDAARVVWDVEFRGLSDDERNTLASFFDQTRGRLHPFLFLDPCGNLLAHSADFRGAEWICDGMIGLAPQEGFVRVTNTAQTPQRLEQTVAAPGSLRYCGSVEARAVEPTSVRVLLRNADGSMSSVSTLGREWTTALCSGALDGTAEDITFGFELPAGASIDVRSAQLEPQPAASAHKRTASTTGLFPETRFDQDELAIRAEGINNHSTKIRLVSRVRL